MESRIGFFINCLHASGSVDMGNRRKLKWRDNRASLQHERRWMVKVKVFARAVSEHRRSEGPERLALLDCRVDPIAHGCVARVCQDRTRSQSAWAEFHAAMQ